MNKNKMISIIHCLIEQANIFGKIDIIDCVNHHKIKPDEDGLTVITKDNKRFKIVVSEIT